MRRVSCAQAVRRPLACQWRSATAARSWRAMSSAPAPRPDAPTPKSLGDDLRFHHVQMFVSSLKPLAEYKETEAALNAFASKFTPGETSIEEGRTAWGELTQAQLPDFESTKRDVVQQMMHGAGWRITATHSGQDSRSVLMQSADSIGVSFVVSAPRTADDVDPATTESAFEHFGASNMAEFASTRAGREGVAVLGFTSTDVAGIHASYAESHPALLVHPDGPLPYTCQGGKARVLDVYAYYNPVEEGEARTADVATKLRFVEWEDEGAREHMLLPGLASTPVVFADDGQVQHSKVNVAYSDHWVTNAVDRTEFLDTLNHTLGFSPKVDFNAGVVAAGEAIIESTVTGNSPDVSLTSVDELLVNQQQIYLPINNALSEVGHVAQYIKQMGQGIQHIANRVMHLPTFISRANAYRDATGEGFAFLNIPRSYYGLLTEVNLSAALAEAGADEGAAGTMMAQLQEKGLMDETGAVCLDATAAHVTGVLGEVADNVMHTVLRSRYVNMYSLLAEHLNEEEYMSVVRNKILVDIQGQDVLYQIFTAPILQQSATNEAPFLEFIQRVCGKQDGTALVAPGCGGFGIRNFLTLFLSIEVSNAMSARERARDAGDSVRAAIAGEMVQVFTQQLDASNPILTDIADAMTAEAHAEAALEKAKAAGDGAKQLEADEEIVKCRTAKEDGNRRLQVVSDEHKALMAALRESMDGPQPA